MTKEEILHLATLSRIKMEDSEVLKFKDEIQSILEYVGKVNSIVGDREVEKTPGAVKNVFREDEVTNEPGSYTKDLVEAFPAKVGSHLKVKKILNPDA